MFFAFVNNAAMNMGVRYFFKIEALSPLDIYQEGEFWAIWQFYF